MTAILCRSQQPAVNHPYLTSEQFPPCHPATKSSSLEDERNPCEQQRSGKRRALLYRSFPLTAGPATLLVARRSSQRPSSFGCFPCTPDNIYRASAVNQSVKAVCISLAVLQPKRGAEYLLFQLSKQLAPLTSQQDRSDSLSKATATS